jgi:hypothetical protein
LVNFLLILENSVEYSKQEIDTGQTPQKIYELCSCIRETFCLSYSIRKDNNLYLYFNEKRLFLSFIGNKLRYLGPDERSQALLLLKALEKGRTIAPSGNHKMVQSTPGIYCTKFLEDSSLINYIANIDDGIVYLIINNSEFIGKKLNIAFLNDKIEIINDKNLYVIPTYPLSSEISEMMIQLKDMKNINLLSLSKIKSTENKILYINFRKDNQETL